MLNKWISFVITFLICLAVFVFTSEKDDLWMNVIISFFLAIFATLFSRSKIFHRLIERSVRPFIKKQ
jgi:predicted membrane channel-forming protein YqfA (hemolysin III family)